MEMYVIKMIKITFLEVYLVHSGLKMQSRLCLAYLEVLEQRPKLLNTFIIAIV